MENNNNFFTDKASIKTIDSIRIIYFLIAVLFFFLTEIGRNIYRPYIYANNIDDYGIADSIGNTGGIIVQIFFMLAILNSPRKKVFRVIGFIVIGYILYEILQPYLPRGVFDWKDIYGTLIGGVISLFVWLFVKKFVKNKVIYEFK
jgi:VanZ family protein